MSSLITIIVSFLSSASSILSSILPCNAPFLINEIFTRRVIPENSVVANLRSQTDFYNYHNPQCSIWNRNVTCPRAKDMEYHSTRY